MSGWIGLIVFVNFLCACVTALLAGIHRAKKHQGKWSIECSHWVCEMVGGGPAVFLSLLIGPTVLLIALAFWWFSVLMKAPYLRSQRPLNEHPTAREKE